MNEYTLASVAAVAAVVAVELAWLKTGVLSTAQFWIAYGIVLFFECLVDGWLTKLSAPIVVYDPSQYTGVRFPFDIPVEDFLFGFALIALTIILWERAGRRRDDGATAANGREARAPTSPR